MLTDLFETSVRKAALEAIPQRGLSKLLFHGGISSVTSLSKTKHAFNSMKQTWLLRDIIIFKRCRAKARRVIL